MVHAKLLIGTCGWSYKHWRKDVFYPSGLKSSEELEFYAEHHDTAEIDYSFYKLPTKDTVAKWRKETPAEFLFSLKASRYITHIKRLKDCSDAWERFLDYWLLLKSKRGPILFQMPPNLQVDVDRLAEFLQLIEKTNARRKNRLRYVFEFRHESWFCDEVFSLLRNFDIALCIADGPKYPRVEEVTSDFSYVRYHGKEDTPNYSTAEMKSEAKFISSLMKKTKEVFVYFNNDTGGCAIKNADTLKELLAG